MAEGVKIDHYLQWNMRFNGANQLQNNNPQNIFSIFFTFIRRII